MTKSKPAAKVYCKDCRYSKNVHCGQCDKIIRINTIGIAPTDQDGEIRHCVEYARPKQQNKNNSCRYYKPKLSVRIAKVFRKVLFFN